MSFHYNPMHHIEYCIFLQTVVGCVRMKGPWMKEPACVLVQMATVGTHVKVSRVFMLLHGFKVVSSYCATTA